MLQSLILLHISTISLPRVIKTFAVFCYFAVGNLLTIAVVEALEQVSHFLRGAGRKVWNMGRGATYRTKGYMLYLISISIGSS